MSSAARLVLLQRGSERAGEGQRGSERAGEGQRGSERAGEGQRGQDTVSVALTEPSPVHAVGRTLEAVGPQTACSSVLCLTQQYSRGNNTVQSNSLKDLLQNKIDDMEKQVLSRVNALEEPKGASRNDSEQRNKVESTLTSLHHRITDLEKGVFAPLPAPSVLLPAGAT